MFGLVEIKVVVLLQSIRKFNFHIVSLLNLTVIRLGSSFRCEDVKMSSKQSEFVFGLKCRTSSVPELIVFQLFLSVYLRLPFANMTDSQRESGGYKSDAVTGNK